jgi:hypothetical protein
MELAIILPFLALMTFGVVEFGLANQDRMTVQAAARTGVRVGSAAGKTADADKNLLLGVGSALRDVGLANVNWILVYKSSTADGAVPVACTNPPRSLSASCNVYTGAQLQQLVAGTAPASWFGCGVSALDRFWCPTARETVQANGTDYLGVWLQATHPMLTGFFGKTLTMTDRGIMRLEPSGG